jgi:hypothetical protein
MGPHEVVACRQLRARLSAECCARRHLARVGIHDVPAYIPCGTCAEGASIVTLLVEAGWAPRPGGPVLAAAQSH